MSSESPHTPEESAAQLLDENNQFRVEGSLALLHDTPDVPTKESLTKYISTSVDFSHVTPQDPQEAEIVRQRIYEIATPLTIKYMSELEPAVQDFLIPPKEAEMEQLAFTLPSIETPLQDVCANLRMVSVLLRYLQKKDIVEDLITNCNKTLAITILYGRGELPSETRGLFTPKEFQEIRKNADLFRNNQDAQAGFTSMETVEKDAHVASQIIATLKNPGMAIADVIFKRDRNQSEQTVNDMKQSEADEKLLLLKEQMRKNVEQRIKYVNELFASYHTSERTPNYKLIFPDEEEIADYIQAEIDFSAYSMNELSWISFHLLRFNPIMQEQFISRGLVVPNDQEIDDTEAASMNAERMMIFLQDDCSNLRTHLLLAHFLGIMSDHSLFEFSVNTPKQLENSLNEAIAQSILLALEPHQEIPDALRRLFSDSSGKLEKIREEIASPEKENPAMRRSYTVATPFIASLLKEYSEAAQSLLGKISNPGFHLAWQILHLDEEGKLPL